MKHDSRSVYFGVKRLVYVAESGAPVEYSTPPPPPTPPPSLAGVILPDLRIAPIMVQLQGNANISGSITYSATVSYFEHGRNDSSPRIRGASPSLTFVLDFGGIVQGGHLIANVSIPYEVEDSGPVVYNLTIEGTITGSNPTKSVVRSAIGAVPLQVIAYKESRFQQFDAAGSPLFGPPNGFGVMQLDTPSPSAAQLWNWRDNVNGGVGLYNSKAAQVRQHFDNIYQAHPQAPRLTDEQFRLALYQFYNGGFYWRYDVTSNTWQKVDTTGYGDDALRIENVVTSGGAPPGWN